MQQRGKTQRQGRAKRAPPLQLQKRTEIPHDVRPPVPEERTGKFGMTVPALIATGSNETGRIPLLGLRRAAGGLLVLEVVEELFGFGVVGGESQGFLGFDARQREFLLIHVDVG